MATVEDLYRQILGRPSDPGGLAYYQDLFGPTIEPEEVNTFLANIAPGAETITQEQARQAATPFISSLQSPVQTINLPVSTPAIDYGPATVELPTNQPSTPTVNFPPPPAASTPTLSTTTESVIIGYDDSGPIYGQATPKESGKSFDDAIKDLYWDVLGREPDAEGLAAYKKAFGSKINPTEEEIFYKNAFPELQSRNDPLYKLYAENLQRGPSLEEYRSARREFGGDVSAQEEQQFFEQNVVPQLRQRQDPIFQLYQNELGRTPDVGGYRYYQDQFGQPTVITDAMRKQFLEGGGYGGSREIPDQMGSAFRELMGRDPTDQEKQELSARVGTLNQDQLGQYLANKNLASRSRYGANPLADYVAKNLPSNLTPFTRTQGYVPLTRPNVSASMNLAGQQYYQTPTASGVNYIGAPVNIAPITQGFQPVGQPSVPSYYQPMGYPQPFQPMGGKGMAFGGFGRSASSPYSTDNFDVGANQQAPRTQSFASLTGKGGTPGTGYPRPITGKGG